MAHDTQTDDDCTIESLRTKYGADYLLQDLEILPVQDMTNQFATILHIQRSPMPLDHLLTKASLISPEHGQCFLRGSKEDLADLAFRLLAVVSENHNLGTLENQEKILKKLQQIECRLPQR